MQDRIIAIPLLPHITEDEALELIAEMQAQFQFHYDPLVWKTSKVDYDLMTAASNLGMKEV